jgi:hypothetical protein
LIIADGGNALYSVYSGGNALYSLSEGDGGNALYSVNNQMNEEQRGILGQKRDKVVDMFLVSRHALKSNMNPEGIYYYYPYILISYIFLIPYLILSLISSTLYLMPCILHLVGLNLSEFSENLHHGTIPTKSQYFNSPTTGTLTI